MAVIKIGANIQEVRQGVGKIYTLFSNLESRVNRIQIGKDLIKQVDALAQSLSKTTVNKDLTAQLNALAKYYRELASAGQKASEVVQKQDQAQAKAVVSVDTLRKSVSNLIGSLKTLQSQYATGTFTDATNGNKEYATSLQEILTELDTYSKKIKNKEELDSTELKRVKELRQQYQQLAAEVAKAKGVTGTKAVASDPFYPKAIDQVTALKARIASLTATMQTARQSK